jgi:hypothetical protein
VFKSSSAACVCKINQPSNRTAPTSLKGTVLIVLKKKCKKIILFELKNIFGAIQQSINVTIELSQFSQLFKPFLFYFKVGFGVQSFILRPKGLKGAVFEPTYVKRDPHYDYHYVIFHWI